MANLTVKAAASRAGVSERTMYMARAVKRLRPDLAAEVQADKMTVGAAYAEAKGNPRPTTWSRLERAWRDASNEERERFLLQIAGDGAHQGTQAQRATVSKIDHK